MLLVNRCTLFGLVAIALYFTSCNPTNKLTGTYRYPINSHTESYKLTIYKDSTFSVMTFNDIMLYDTINGKWNIIEKKLLLTQNEIKKKDSLLTVIENINGSDAGVTIHLIDDDNEAVVGAGMEVNGDARHYVTDLSGRVNIPQVKTLKHIHLIYVGVDENIIIKNNVANDITIIVNYKSLPRFHWARVPNLWLIKRNKIIPMG